MKIYNSNQGLSVKCGKMTNSFEELKTLCETEADDIHQVIRKTLSSLFPEK